MKLRSHTVPANRRRSCTVACSLALGMGIGSVIAAEPPEARVQNFGAITDDGVSDSAAIKRAILALQSGQTLLFPKGVYDLDSVVWIEKARGIRLLGQEGAIIKKTGRFQFMMAFIAGTDVTVEGLAFEGATPDRAGVAWGEEGIYFGSCVRPTVKNCRFANFGDAAVRMTTSLVKGATDSSDGKIVDCHFENVTQITTTQGMEGNYGGTSGMLIRGNVFENLKASIKLATRAPASRGKIIGNHIRSSRRDGIQVESVSDVLIDGNTLEHIAGTSIILNVNDHVPRDAPGFAWDRVSVRNNRIRGASRGIHVDLKPYLDGSQFDMAGLEIVGNHFEDITDASSDAVIWLGNTTRKSFLAPLIGNNAFKNTSRLAAIRCPPGVKLTSPPARTMPGSSIFNADSPRFAE